MSYTLCSHVYFDTIDKMYYNIITINTMPVGVLAQLVVPFKNNKVSAYSTPETQCGLAFKSNRNKFMRVNELPELISFLLQNDYIVDTQLTTMILKTNVSNRLIAYILTKN